MRRLTLLLRGSGCRKRWLCRLILHPAIVRTRRNHVWRGYAEYIMQSFGKTEYMGHMEWTEVVMEVGVHQGVVNRKKDCLALRLWRLGEEC